MLEIRMPKILCKNCGHLWAPRSKKVYTCPKCHSCCHLKAVKEGSEKCSEE